MSPQRLDAVAWMDDAACASRTDLPWLGDDARTHATKTMAAICRTCLVLDQCEAFVRADGIVGGFWAGRDRGPALIPTQADLFGQAG